VARVAAGALAGGCAGLIVGIGARVAMRMVALGVPDGVMQPSVTFTAQGTSLILLVGIIAGIAFGIIYDAIADRLPGPFLVRGLLFAAIDLLVIGPLLFSQADEFISQGRVVLFALLFPVFGIALSAIDPLARRAIVAMGGL